MAEKYPVSLFYWISAANDTAADFSDGAWEAYLKESVTRYNKEHGTSFDEHEAWHAWLRWQDTEREYI